jgi:hypothetical protein
MSIETLKLEIVRPGPLHGQLVSRLTNYVSLCDGVEADTIRFPFDHYLLKEDLKALRYFVGGADARVPNELRASAVERLSQALSEVLGGMRGFQTRLAEMASKTELAHLRLVLGGGELSLVPFELATLPPGWRAAGGKMSLDAAPPIVVTRELRDSSRIPLNWNRRPRVLFCTASPDGYARVPARAHLLSILRALRPWIDGGRERGKPLEPHDVVTVLENASLDSIRAATSRAEYTHVHILCHGCLLPGPNERYGLALAHPRDPRIAEPVDASMLAGALWDRTEKREPPTMVMLASCDSGNQNTVEAPGSSLAHELHRKGVPWVVASQMPLTFQGSATLARVFYEGIMAGLDPRYVLSCVRRELVRQQDSHDWASVVAYVAIPADFDRQVRRFRIKQLHRCIDSAFERARNADPDTDGRAADARAREFARIDELLEKWQRAVEADESGFESSEYFGMKGAVAKQKAELGQHSDRLLREALNHYKQAMERNMGSHWVVVQYLSLRSLLKPDDRSEDWLFALADLTAKRDLGDPAERKWALGSLIELAILKGDQDAAKKWAEDLAAITKPGDFELFSTRRQLNRYVKGLLRNASGRIVQLAAEALAILANDKG